MNFHKIVLVVTLMVFVVVPATAKNVCRPGKAEVILLLPSGQSKTICVAESALPGLQNAGEHSSGKFVTTACPCFSESDVQAIFDNDDGLDDCAFQTMTNGYILASCADSTAQFLVTNGPTQGVRLVGLPIIDSPSCAAKVGGDLTFSEDLAAPAVDACFEVLESFLPP